MPVSRPDSVLQLTGFPTAVKNVPANWPTGPQVGKISLLWQYNQTDIYHKFSPYTEGENPFGIIPNKQPFVWRFIDEKNKGLFNDLKPSVKVLADTAGLTQSGVDDLVRVSKWMVTGNGVRWLISQGVLQSYNAFSETTVYNPLEAVIATARPLSLGLLNRPIRYVDIYNPLSILGIGGSNNGGLLSGVGNLAAGAASYAATTALNRGLAALAGGTARPSPLRTNASSYEMSGVLRVMTGNRAKSTLISKWPSGNANQIIGGTITTMVDPLIPAGIPRKLPADVTYRQDEKTYEAMLSDRNGNLTGYYLEGGDYDAAAQMRFNSSVSATANNRNKRIWIPLGSGKFGTLTTSGGRIGKTISGQTTGYQYNGKEASVSDILGGNSLLSIGFNALQNVLSQFGIGPGTGPANENKTVYGKTIGRDAQDPDTLKYSDATANLADYIADDGTKFESKLQNPSAKYGYNVKAINESLQKAINGIYKLGKSNTYQVTINADTALMRVGKPSDVDSAGYNAIDALSNTDKNPEYRKRSQNTYGVGKQYYSSGGTNFAAKAMRPVDNTFNIKKNLRFATTFTSDGINLLPVLKGDKSIPSSYALSDMYPGWTVWKPEQDDLIAFYFYDMVNDKYIPFRATVKGLSEGNTAYWDELRFIGRADQLYSYNGYSRTLSFTFNIVINSVTELLPTWKKINYLAGIIKPSNYTSSDKFAEKYSKFIVPPMFMVTIGDLYKYQPMVVTSMNINIPDDASWETLNENNAPDGWEYLNGIITSAGVSGRKAYAQVPREVEIAITANLLEKERAIVGAAHFGHAPHKDSYVDGEFNTSNSVTYLPEPTVFSQKMLEYTQLGTSEATKKPNNQVVPPTPAPQPASPTGTPNKILSSPTLPAVPPVYNPPLIPNPALTQFT